MITFTKDELEMMSSAIDYYINDLSERDDEDEEDKEERINILSDASDKIVDLIKITK